MKPVVAIIAQGNMGASIASLLTENGLKVTTSLTGRSAASAKRAEAAGMQAVSEAEIAEADFILSILPPGDAVGLAQQLAPHMKAAKKKPLYADCNATSPQTAEEIAKIVTAAGAGFLDGGIIGSPRGPGEPGPVFYISGPAADAKRFADLGQYGLLVKVLDAPVGGASSLKMTFGGITKCTTAVGAAMVLAAGRSGVQDALRAELGERLPGLLEWLDRSFPPLFSKAYRFVDEMEEIAQFLEPRGENEIYRGAANLFQTVADDWNGAKKDVEVLAKFAARAKKQG
jgi:3-hydroxyisobutyrate dehydrogenase-like beta-hydroxyacid dehydrogenase